MTTDRGPNEVLGRKVWTTLRRDCPNIVSLSSDCFEHASHLVSLGTLKTLDDVLRRFGRKWKFFSSLATSSHTLRDLSKSLYERWCVVHSDISGLKCAKKLWPKVVGGRWNSCSEALARMKQVGGQSMLEPVLRDLLESKQNKKRTDPCKAEDESHENDRSRVLDEISYDATKAYQVKMGRWRKQTWDCVQDTLWWIVSELMRVVQLPMVHFSATCSNF